MATRDAMQFINEQDEATLDRFIKRLEFRGTDPTFVAYREAYLELLDLSGTVLDLGCGTGVVARALAARDGFDGTVTAIDQSPKLIAAAERFAADEGVGDRIEFGVGDVHARELPDASFGAPSPTRSLATCASLRRCSPRRRAWYGPAAKWRSSTATTRR